MGKRKILRKYRNAVHYKRRKNRRVVLAEIQNTEQQDFNESVDSTSSLPSLNIEEELKPTENVPKVGRRLVDIEYFLTQMTAISNHCPKFGCNLCNLKVTAEVRNGLDSTVKFTCSMCAQTFDVRLIEKKDKGMNVNHQIVSGVMSCGSGHSHLQTIMASIELPGISPVFYSVLHNDICNWWETAASQSMAEAIKEEADYAVSIGSVDDSGRPMIAVAADGCWSKRSYGKNYSALSGAAAIIGLKFGKVLYLGVKNKFCIVCARAVNSDKTPEHVCYKNYSGSSTAMESTILVEGFKRSLVDHGVIYHKFVADGDSSTYKKILDARPYGDVTIEKIECKNHLMRNYCNALVKLSQDTKFPPELRKILRSRYLRLRTGVTYAIKYWNAQNLPLDQKIINLSKDILNGPCHVFGNHENCCDYFCTIEKRQPEPIGLMAQLISSGLFHAIENLSKKLSYHSRSLIHNATSNLVESFNAQIAKYVGGKRVNYSLRRSYAGRCAAAVVSFNTGTLHTKTHKAIFGTAPNNLITNLEKNRCKTNKKCSKKSKKPTATVLKDADYGENAQQPDMSPDMFEEAKMTFLNRLQLSSVEREILENSTTLQRNSIEWIERRRKLLTSSLFGDICKKRASTSCANLVKKIIYGRSISNIPAVRYGIDNEEIAIRQLEVQENISIESCGLFVDHENPFLGTTPDGKYTDGIVEIKCPSSLANISLTDAMKKHPFWKWDPSSKSYIINIQHNWYYQIQGQLHITQKDICMLGIWFGPDLPMKVYHIHRDDEFWKTKMETKLIRFYHDCLLPELVDPRNSRCMPIKDPPYIVKAMEEKNERKERTNHDDGDDDRDLVPGTSKN